MKESAIENHVSGFFIKSPTFFQRFIIKYDGVFGVVSPYLELHDFILNPNPTHNSYNGGEKYLSHQFIYKFQSCITLVVALKI
jgi:hypothetical protein